MIRLASLQQSPAISAVCRYALDLLVDLSGLPRVEDERADVVCLLPDHEIPDGVRTARDLAEWRPRVTDGQVRVGCDALSVISDVASASAEQQSQAGDPFDRVPSRINALVAERLERIPLVDATAGRLAQAAQQASGRRVFRLLPPWPNGASWAAALTHDLDVVSWWPVFAGLRWIELARSAELGMLSRALLAALRRVIGNPVLQATRTVLEIEAGAGFSSTWFVLSGTPTFSTFRRGDLTYRLEGHRARTILERVREAGHEFGLHGSFRTFDDPGAFRNERMLAASIIHDSINGVRQHFLRMRPPATQRAMALAGFSYDASFGFPDRNGFRLGSASLIPAWDAIRKETIGIDLVPLTWMDRAMSKYSGIQDPTRWVDDALALAHTARGVNGVWVGLWHPNLCDALGYPGAPEQYRRLVRELRAMQPYNATLEELVAWRRRRRAFRVKQLAADGRMDSNDPALQEQLLIAVTR